MVLVRNFIKADKDSILGLGDKIFRENDEIPLLQKALSICIPELSFVAIDDTAIVGFTLVCKTLPDIYCNYITKIPNCYELAFLGISEGQQGRGLGTRLLKETLVAIFQTSFQFTCWLLVDTINTTAIKLYEKFGFRRWIMTTDTYLPCYIMGLSYRRYERKNNINISMIPQYICT